MSRNHNFINLCCGLMATTAVVMIAPSAEALIVTVQGRKWEVSTIRGSYQEWEALELDQQFWWGSAALAEEFTTVVADGLNTAQISTGGNQVLQPFFRYTTSPNTCGGGTASCNVGFAYNTLFNEVQGPWFGQNQASVVTYAVAKEIPTPIAILPTLFGMTIGAVRKRSAQDMG